MVPLFVLIGAGLLARTLGAIGLPFFDSWPAATRAGIAVMLLATATAHFTSLRLDLARMVPSWVPRPMAVVYFTGVCEILGGIGLVLPPTREIATVALIVFFIAVFPANVRAARDGISLGGAPVTPLWLRAPMQGVFVFLTWWAGIGGVP